MRLLIILFFLLELLVFVLIGKWIGFGWAVALIIASSVAGFVFLRASNLSNMQKLQARMAKGELPLKELMNAPFRMFAAFLLIIPGFISSLLGLICIMPFMRKHLLRWMMSSKLMQKMSQQGMSNMGNMGNMHNMGNMNNMKSPFTMNLDNTESNLHKKNPASANDEKTLEGEYWTDEKKLDSDDDKK